MTEHDRRTRPAGRPRDVSIDERVLSVTRELLALLREPGLANYFRENATTEDRCVQLQRDALRGAHPDRRDALRPQRAYGGSTVVL
jgi:hypothetical protein